MSLKRVDVNFFVGPDEGCFFAEGHCVWSFIHEMKDVPHVIKP